MSNTLGSLILQWLSDSKSNVQTKVGVFDTESNLPYISTPIVYNIAFSSVNLTQVGSIGDTYIYDYINMDVLKNPKIVSTLRTWKSIKNAPANSATGKSLGMLLSEDDSQKLSKSQQELKSYYSQEGQDKISYNEKTIDRQTKFKAQQIIAALTSVDELYESRKQTDYIRARRENITNIIQNRLTSQEYQLSSLYSSVIIPKLQTEKGRPDRFTKEDIQVFERSLLQSVYGEDAKYVRPVQDQNYLNLEKALQEYFNKKNSPVLSWQSICNRFNAFAKSQGLIVSHNFAFDKRVIENTNKYCQVKKGIVFDDLTSKCSLNLFKDIQKGINNNPEGFLSYLGRKEANRIINAISSMTTSKTSDTASTTLDAFVNVFGNISDLTGMTRHTAKDDVAFLKNAILGMTKTALTQTLKKK